MSAEEILITHQGYTDTAYSSCGDFGCTVVLLRAVGVPEADAADPESVNDLDIGDDVQITCGILGESDCDEWCACCGVFIRHGLECEYKRDADGDLPDREDIGASHIDLRDNEIIKAFWS